MGTGDGMTTTAKLANRHMLYAETLAGWFAVSSGISIWVSKGMLWKVIQARMGSEVYSAVLGLPLIAAGVAMIAVCVFEWFAGRDWPVERIRRWSRLRQWLCIGLALVHAALLVGLIQMGAFWAAPAVTMNCLALMAFFAIAAVKAMRLCVALDPLVPTERLHREIARTW